MQPAESVHMKSLMGKLLLPILLEVANLLLHRLTHWMNFGGAYVDTASTLVSITIVFYAGWIASRLTRRYFPAMLAGLIVWAFSIALAGLLMIGEIVFFEATLSTGDKWDAITGALISSMLVLPAVIAISAIAAFAARRTAP